MSLRPVIINVWDVAPYAERILRSTRARMDAFCDLRKTWNESTHDRRSLQNLKSRSRRIASKRHLVVEQGQEAQLVFLTDGVAARMVRGVSEGEDVALAGQVDQVQA